MLVRCVHILCVVLVGCGPLGTSGSGDEEPRKRSKPPESREDAQPDQVTGGGDPGVPVDTFLASPRIPEAVDAGELTLRFRSNAAGATFECRDGSEDRYKECKDARYRFADLVHGRAYSLSVRARDSSGRVDQTPLQVRFRVDRQGGAPYGGDRDPRVNQGRQRIDPRDFPGSGSPQTGEGESGSPRPDADQVLRSIQVGSDYAVTVPYGMVVTSYSTDKTPDQGLRIVRRMGPHGGRAYAGLPCRHEWEKAVEARSGGRYCDATPTTEQWRRAYRNTLPRNHVELVRGSGATTGEKIFLAAFDGPTDPTGGRLGIEATCRYSRRHGRTAVPAMNRYFGVQPERETFRWCQVEDSRGKWWWVGALDVPAPNRSGWVRVIYSVAAERGIGSGRRFAAKAAGLLPEMLSPLRAETSP